MTGPELFQGCEWENTEFKRIVTPHHSEPLDAKRFNVVYGGRTFMLGQHVTRSAWKAFRYFYQTDQLFSRKNLTLPRPAGEVVISEYWPDGDPK